MSSTPLSSPSLSLAIAERLRARILARDWAPGEELSDGAIAQAYGVSRTPVREAFKLLCHEGLLQAHPRRGVTVVQLDAAQQREAHALLQCLQAFVQQQPPVPNGAAESFAQRLLHMAQQRALLATLSHQAALPTAEHLPLSEHPMEAPAH